jgi:hypothetical protein
VSDSSRNVTDEERFHLYRLCQCTTCQGTGKAGLPKFGEHRPFYARDSRCPECRGEGRTRDLVATCATPEAVGVALVTLGREGEWNECPVGVLDTMGEPGEKWIVRPWLPSARNLSDAGRTLRQAQENRK